MRKLLILTLLALMIMAAATVTAQDSGSFCVAEFEAVLSTASEACAGLEADQLCYASTPVNAVPRLLTAEFDFDEPGERLNIPQMETMTTEIRGDGDYGMARFDLSVGLVGEVVQGVVFGNTFTANNVLPEIQLAFTSNTLATLRSEPDATGEVVVELVPGDALTASGRVGPQNEITGDTWVRAVWDASGDAGWIQAAELTEDYLVLSLPVVLAEDPTFAPMQALTTTSVRADRGCDEVPDSGLLLQSPDEGVNMRFNSVDMALEPNTTVYVQAQPNAVMDVYVLAGAADTGGERIEAGTMMSYNVGPDALTTGRAMDEPATYPDAKVMPLVLLSGVLASEVSIAPGTSDGTTDTSIASIVPETGETGVEVAEAPAAEGAGEEESASTGGFGGIIGSLLGGGVDDEAPAVEAAAEIEETPEVAVLATATALSEIVVGDEAAEVVVGDEATEVDVEATASALSEVVGGGEVVAQLPTESAEVVEPVSAVEVEPGSAQVASPPPIGDTNVATSPFANTLRERGVVRIGVNGNLPTFSEEAGGAYAGFEPNLARELVRRLFGDTVTIEWVQVSSRQRSGVLADGTVDIMIRNTSFAPERSTWGEWTDQFYFVDGQRFLVRADRGITGDGDLGGLAVAVQAGTNAETTLNAFAATTGVTAVPLQGTLVEFVSDLDSGFVDAISSDWTALEAIRQSTDNPDDFVVVGDLLTSIPWNIATAPGETGLNDDIEFALNVMIEDGTWLEIYNLSFNQPPPPTAAAALVPGAPDVEPVIAEEVQPPAVAEEVAPPPVAEQPSVAAAPAATPLPETDLPITGEVPVTIFTAQTQQRIMRITPNADGSFTVELIRQGEIVYDGVFAFYESSGRYENKFNSFEYIEFSDSAGDQSQGCGRPADIEGVFNGAPFEVKLGC